MKQSHYLVAGLGKTGLSIARYLQRNNQAFIVFDTRKDAPGLEEFKAGFPTIPIYLQDLPYDQLRHITDIIASPGLSLDIPLIKEAMDLGIAIYGDIECLAREITAPVVAITGTNGKSTVTTLVGEMAKAAGYDVAVAGNIGTPVLDMLADGHHYDLWVLELSSFQLELTSTLAPKASTILNVSPDHLDRHHTLDAYVQAKQRIYHQAKTVVFNREDAYTIPEDENYFETQSLSFGKDLPLLPEYWGIEEKKGVFYLSKGQELIIPIDEMGIKGIHNWQNALAACALAESVGIARQHMVSVLKTFTGLPHRCQWVRTLDNVQWINDSKGTNIGATISAINGIGGAMQGKIVLIAGGQGKGADFNELSEPVADYVRTIVLIGEDANKIETALAQVTPIVRADSLEQAVLLAKEHAQPGDVVLLSPACASLDMFRDFNHRGDVFTSSVQGL